jgi:hypothetical protein
VCKVLTGRPREINGLPNITNYSAQHERNIAIPASFAPVADQCQNANVPSG